jgi:hypothetical protein
MAEDIFGGDGYETSMEDQLRQIQALASMDSTYAASQEYQDLMAELEKSRQAQPTGTSTQTQEHEEEEEEEEDSEDEEEDDEEDIDDVFGVTQTSKSGKEIKLNFEPPKEMVKLLNSHYGIEDAATFFSSVDTWRQQAQEGAEVSRELDAITADLQAMPPEIRMAVELWANGDDYQKVFNASQRLDYSDDFKSQDPERLVQHYLPEQYEELVDSLESGTIDEDEFMDKVKLLSGSTKRLFTEDKQAIENEREEYAKMQERQHKAMKQTALLSVENLSKAYPNFSKTEVNKIRSILVEGKVENLFMKSDGSYNDDAAELVAYAMYGKKMLESVKKIAERKGETKANIKAVDSSPKTVKKQKASGGNNALNMQAVGHLSSIISNNDPYASR